MSKKFIIIASTTVLGVLIASTAIFVNSSTRQETPKKYAYTKLGDRCSTAAVSFHAKAQNLSEQAKKDYDAVQDEADKTQAMLDANTSYNTSSLNNARKDYLAIYNQGGMTYEEYKDKVAQLDAAQATAGTPSGSVQSEINRIRSEAIKYYEDNKQKVTDMQTSAAKLESCANSVKAQRDFTVSDVAEFEALISNSY